jgi:Flp pilus assembly protein TadG
MARTVDAESFANASAAAKVRPHGHSRLRDPRGDERGSELVELAVILPVFFLLLFGLFNFSIVLFGYSNATYATRAATRYAALHSSTSLVPSTTASIQSYATQFLFAAPAGG